MNEPFWKYQVNVKIIYLDHINVDGRIIQVRAFASVKIYEDWIYNAGIDDDCYTQTFIDATWYAFVFHNAKDAILFRLVWG